MQVASDVPLAPLTTLKLGGRAKMLVEVEHDVDVAEVAALAEREKKALFVLGGGSNLVVGDAGFDGIVAKIASRGIAVAPDGPRVLVEVAAGESWDAFVGRCVDDGFSGVECLSGIPGLVGATPIQNVGAYGQEVSDTIVSVRAYDLRTGAFVVIPAAKCGFSYRDSAFKRDPHHVVVSVTFGLERNATAANVRYPELARALGTTGEARVPSSLVRETVIALRRAKGMVIDPTDEDSVSAGSFFTNPIVDDDALAAFDAKVSARGIASAPRFPAGGGRTKLSAGWLVEHAGFARGYGDGRVGVSRKHALALVHRGGGTTTELVALARVVREGVFSAFGITLVPEPVFLGVVF